MPLRIAVDIGGTFTDGVASDVVSRRIWVGKCLTTPSDPGEGVSNVLDQLLGEISKSTSALTAADIQEVVHATTLVTNTLIERKGTRVALVLTAGTADALDIRREIRYDLYDLNIELPPPLVEEASRFEIDERIDFTGQVVTALTPAALADLVKRLAAANVDAVAVCLLHSYANSDHERAIESAVRSALPRVEISLSSQISPEPREFERMSTTVANAYVQPLMTKYLGTIDRRLTDMNIRANLRIMQSSGGFTAAEVARSMPIQLLESGPAAGVVSAINTGDQARERQILAFDMGGTTAKACLVVDGEPTLTRVFEAGRIKRFKRGSGLPIMVPSIDLIEIGAGGGSIASVSLIGSLAVGPQSAGAEPGPVCYGLGGTQPTVTDADVALGYLDPDRFLGGTMRLDAAAAHKALTELGGRLGLTMIETAWGICSIVNENMAGAARVHIAEKGFDPRAFTLICTGGAGPVHAVDVARRLRIKRILCPLAAGAGSCLGLLSAAARVERLMSRRAAVNAVDWRDINAVLRTLYDDAVAELSQTNADLNAIVWSLSLDMRYAGQGHNVEVALPYGELNAASAEALLRAFDSRYRHLFGSVVPGGVPEIVSWRLIGQAPRAAHSFAWADGRDSTTKAEPYARRQIFLPLQGGFGDVSVYDRYSLPAGTRLEGPLILQERESTLVVPCPATVTVLQERTVQIDLEPA